MLKTKKVIRILWMYDQPIEETNGGTERATALIMQGLEKLGYSCFGCLVIPIDESNPITYEEKEITDIYRFLKNNNIDIVINQLAFDKRLLERFFVSGGEKWKSEGGKLISCMHFAPDMVTFSLHDAISEWKRLSLYRKLKRCVFIALSPLYYYRSRMRLKRGIKYCHDKSNKYVTLSQTHISRILQIIGANESEKLIAINNPLSFQRSSSKDELLTKDKIVLSVSRLCEKQKKLSLILKAWKKIQSLPEVRDWKLIIVGDGADRPFYEKMIMKQDIVRVELHGQKDPDYEYAKAAIFVSASPSEGWGLTITEAMQRACVPVVMNSSSVFSEMVNHRIDGILIKNGDCTQMANELVYLITNADKRQNMACTGLQSCQRFNLSSTAMKWHKLITTL